MKEVFVFAPKNMYCRGMWSEVLAESVQHPYFRFEIEHGLVWIILEHGDSMDAEVNLHHLGEINIEMEAHLKKLGLKKIQIEDAIPKPPKAPVNPVPKLDEEMIITGLLRVPRFAAEYETVGFVLVDRLKDDYVLQMQRDPMDPFQYIKTLIQREGNRPLIRWQIVKEELMEGTDIKVKFTAKELPIAREELE